MPNSLAQSEIRFSEAAFAAGLRFDHTDGGDREPYLPTLMVAGVAIFDYDGDGWQDVYFLNNHSLTNPLNKRQGNSLFRNRGDGTFVEVTDQAGARSFGFALGVVAADIDNDGDVDLLLSNYGPAELLRNNGDGTFSKEPNAFPLQNDSPMFGAGIACLDIDNDGLLDVFIGVYVDFSMERYREIAPRSFPYPPGPRDFPPSPDKLYRNRGDGSFEDVSVRSGIARYPGPSMGVICGDWDRDHDIDIFVCSDAAPNQLFVNDGTGKFEDLAVLRGVAFDFAGNANGSMGVDAGDYDGDGWEDLLITNYTDQTPVLYRNLDGALFEDVSRQTRVGREVLLHTNWGVGLVDFDNDRDPDVFFANGHFLKNIHSIDSRTSYRVANSLVLNDGMGRFQDISKSAGEGLSIAESSRGAAFGDLDRDGDVDAVILNANAPCSLLWNNSKPVGGWVSVRLVGKKCNRDAIGAEVIVRLGGTQLRQTVHAGRGYQSHYGTELHFGVGASKRIDSIDVVWPNGTIETFPGVETGIRLLLIESTSDK
ncbi:MAG: CRTAC1 family protein [Pirellula sp.]